MKVKICGLKTKGDVETAVRNGADYIGFVFAESRRRITPKHARRISKMIPKSVKKVGVFVSPTLDELEAIITAADLDLVQIHGERPANRFSVPHIRAVAVKDTLDLAVLANDPAEYLLFDAPPQKYVGGNGQTFDWEKLQLNDLSDKKVFIAGGLTVDNVQTARQLFNPYAVDISSGVETNGEKDCEKIAEFLKKAKEEM
ncbi:phosphoribosylanthranilate isomerase [Enterococcus sp. LJL51]|uniref:phosphoribosylanthranilate isomerase n=1 Tax=Enterococcus sp. LJL51 TaxID=3416656 RepID=UPI003CF4F2E7